MVTNETSKAAIAFPTEMGGDMRHRIISGRVVSALFSDLAFHSVYFPQIEKEFDEYCETISDVISHVVQMNDVIIGDGVPQQGEHSYLRPLGS